MAEEKKIVLSIETITDQAVMEAYGRVLNDVLGSYEDNIALIAQYNAQIKDNQARIKEIEKATETFGKVTKKQAEELAHLTAENIKLKQAKAELVQITKNQEKIDTTQAGTMENQAQLLGKLREAWRMMTDEQKAANQGMLETIQQLDAGLKQSDAEIGNFQRNVGNYAGGIAQALARLNILPPQIATYVSAISRLQVAYKTLSKVIGTSAVTSVRGFIAALGGVKKALISTGIGALIVAVGMLIAHWDDLKKLIENTNPEMKARKALAEYRLEIEKLTAQASSEKIVKIRDLARAYKSIGDNAKEKQAFLEAYRGSLADVGIEVNNINQLDRVLINNTEGYIKAIVARTKADAIRAKAAKDYEAALNQMAEIKKTAEDAKAGDMPWWVDAATLMQQMTAFSPLADILTKALDLNIEKEAIKAFANQLNSEYKKIATDAEANLKASLEEAAKLDKEANAYLKPAGGKGGGGKSEAQRQAEEAAKQRQRELDAIAKYNAEANHLLTDEQTQELEKLKDSYETKLALFNKYGIDTTALTLVYEAQRAAIIKKYADAEHEAFIEKTNKEMSDSSDIIIEEFKELEQDLEKELGTIEKVAVSPLARALGITDEQLGSIKQQALQAASQIFNSIQKLANDASQRRLDDALDKIEREAESEKAILEAKLENKLISQKEYEKKLAELDEQTTARKEEANKEAFKKQKAWNIAQALMNGALAVTNIWAQHGGNPIVAGILTAIAATANAVEIAAIAAQKYARGGELHGPSHAQGGIKGFVGNQHIEAEGGEVIINKRSSAKHRKLLSLINSDNGWGDDFAHARGGSGRFFARGGMIGGYDFRTAPLPEASSTLAQFARRQADNLQASFEAINRRIDNLRVSVLLSDIEAKSNEKRVHVSRAVL